MPDLKWDEHDLRECLAVLPETDENAVSHTYRLDDGTQALHFTLWQYESVAEFTILRAGTDTVFLRFALVIRDGIHHRHGKADQWLEFRDCLVVPSRFYYRDTGNVFDRGRYPTGITMKLSAYPILLLRLDTAKLSW